MSAFKSSWVRSIIDFVTFSWSLTLVQLVEVVVLIVHERGPPFLEKINLKILLIITISAYLAIRSASWSVCWWVRWRFQRTLQKWKELLFIGKTFHPRRSHGCYPAHATGGSLPYWRKLLGNKEWSKELRVPNQYSLYPSGHMDRLRKGLLTLKSSILVELREENSQ